MATLQPALVWSNPHSLLHVAEEPGGVLAVMVGVCCIERVPRDAGKVQYRLAMGRLVNAGWPVTVLAERLGHDTRTLRGWGEALLCADPGEMVRGLSGRGAEGKVTGTMVEFVLDWLDELKGRARSFRARILAKVAQVFGVELSWEALRRPLQAGCRERAAGEPLASCGGEPLAGESAEDAAAGTAGPDPAGGGAGLPATGCGTRAGNVAGGSGEPQPEADPEAGMRSAVPASAAAGSAAGGQSGGSRPAAPGAGGGGDGPGIGGGSPAAAAAVAAGRPSVPAGAVIPGGWTVPRGPVLAHHAGQLLAAPWLAAAGLTSGSAEGAPLTWCAQVLQGGANIEQVRDLGSADLAWFTGVPVATAEVQRQTLGRLLLRDRPLWMELLRGNALLLADGPGRGTVFYYDPHTKEYTGGLPFLKGWCGRRHAVAKVLHLDFFHTRGGHPCFVFPADNYEDMRERFFTELEWFDLLFPPEGRRGRLFVIDRGIYGIETFERFTARGDWLLTWEKDYAGDGWVEGAPETGFALTRPRNRRDNLRAWTFRVQEQPWRRQPAWRRFVVRATNPEGRTIEVAVLCSDPSVAVAEAVTLIFSRWLQENDFRILDQHFGMMQMTARRSQSYAELAHTLPDRPVESLEYRQLHAAAAALRQTLRKLLYDREQVTDALARMEREGAAARLRLERDLPRLRQRLECCRADPDASGKELRKLAALGALAAELQRCHKSLRKATGGRPKLETRLQALQVDIDTAKSQSEALDERLRAACREDSKLRFLADEGYRRPDTAAKHLMDCTKIVARNVFYCLLEDFRRHYDNRRDDLPILRLVIRAAGTLHVRDGVLQVGLWLRASLEPAVRASIDAFLADVSGQINARFAGRAVPVHISLLGAAPEL